MQIVDFQVCRGCLATDTRMVDTRQSSASDFTQLVEFLPTSKVGLPPCVCYECLAQLTKMRDFHAKNQRAYNVLLKIIRQKGWIEETDIKQINRTRQSLVTSLKYHRIESISIEPEFAYSEVAVEDRKDVIIPEVNELHDNFIIEFPQDEKIKNEDLFEDFNSFPDDEPDDVTTTDVTLENKAEKENLKETDQKEVETERKEDKNAKNIMTKSRKRKTSEENSEQEPGAEAQNLPKVKKKQSPGTPLKEDTMKCNYTEDVHSFATVTVMSEEERLEVFKQRSEKEQYINADYKCTDCLYGFTSTETYEKHRKKHDPNIGAYVCPLCTCRYKNQALQKKHIAMIHRTKFECKHCPYVCTSGQLARKHSRKHSSATYRCEECNFISAHQASYDLHISTMHGKETPCPWCGVSFLDVIAMRAHMASNHPKPSRGQSRLRCECRAFFYNPEARKLHRSTSSKHNPDGNTLLSCALCDSRFTDKQSLQAHMLTHPQERKSAACDPRFTKMTCEKCGEVMPHRRAYRTHYRRIHPEIAITCFPTVHNPDNMLCDICGKMIQGVHSLKAHKLLHTELRPFVCKICHKTFSRRLNYDIHINIHTKRKVYKCRVCGKGFNHASNRDRHRQVHTQESLFSCDICGKSFKSQSGMSSHTKYVHTKMPWPKRNRSKRKATQRQQCSDQDSSD